MFTGIVETTATVVEVHHAGAGSRLRLDLGPVFTDPSEAVLGASIAIDGCCLTVVAREGTSATFDVAPETLDRTTLGALARGDEVNVERSLRLSDRLDGHLVTGHVDGVATVSAVGGRGSELDVDVELPEAFRRGVVEKGSITLAGVSLTITGLSARGCRVMLIPHTAAVTTLGRVREGSRLNFEIDLIGKWVARWLEARFRGT